VQGQLGDDDDEGDVNQNQGQLGGDDDEDEVNENQSQPLTPLPAPPAQVQQIDRLPWQLASSLLSALFNRTVSYYIALIVLTLAGQLSPAGAPARRPRCSVVHGISSLPAALPLSP
jgi:hypothetical protein